MLFHVQTEFDTCFRKATSTELAGLSIIIFFTYFAMAKFRAPEFLVIQFSSYSALTHQKESITKLLSTVWQVATNINLFLQQYINPALIYATKTVASTVEVKKKEKQKQTTKSETFHTWKTKKKVLPKAGSRSLHNFDQHTSWRRF